MVVEGKIVAVMESWPLQLTVETQSGPLHVGLQSGTVVTEQGSAVDPNRLRPEMRVRIEGDRTGANAVTARSITILA